jgi:hypothetical protein
MRLERKPLAERPIVKPSVCGNYTAGRIPGILHFMGSAPPRVMYLVSVAERNIH